MFNDSNDIYNYSFKIIINLLIFIDLAEVAAVCRRVNFSHKEMDINIMGFDDLLMDIDRIWAEMEPFYTNIPVIYLFFNVKKTGNFFFISI